ncbi:MAG: hypothetical protein ABSA27_14935 [Terriglobales bacterium]|jgi:hypothetical protein
MIAIAVFHVLMFLLGLALVTRAVPVERVSDMLGYLHNAIGVSMPPLGQVRTIALIWIGATIIIVDGCIFLLFFITKMLS